jgi:hypothetical protein
VVEFALILPIIAFLLVGILDFSRVFTAMMTVESAAREAADYGAWQSGNWSGDLDDTDSAHHKTIDGMKGRACIASRNLWDFSGDLADCTNPSIAIDVIDQNGNSAVGSDGLIEADCDEAVRKAGANDLGPCRVKVDLTYTFDLIVPIGFDVGGTRLGLPQTVTFVRSSTFAISDFSVDPT